MAEDSPVIAIDGPSGSGKGVIAHKLAAHLGFHILDSGALYRLIGLAAKKHGINFDDEATLTEQCHISSTRRNASLSSHLPVLLIRTRYV